MFSPSRDQARRFFFDTWNKHREKQPMVGLENVALDSADGLPVLKAKKPPRLVEIRNRVYPDYPESLDEIRHDDTTWDSRRYERLRLVAEDADGRMVAYGQMSHMPSHFHPPRGDCG